MRRGYLLPRLVTLVLSVAGVVKTGAPLLDYFLYHRGVHTEARPGIHYDKPGGHGQHAEQCAIMAQRPGLAAPPAVGAPAHRVFAVVEAPVPLLVPQAFSTGVRFHPSSRAPPFVSLS